MINEQVFLKENLPRIEDIFTSYSFPIEELKKLAEEVQHFSVRLPLIGSFSAGKSSLLNFLLDESLLSVALNPETCLPTELHFANNERITLHQPEKGPALLDRISLNTQNFGNVENGSWVEVATPSPVLAQLAGMTLVDMPGWESGIEQHSNAIDNYLERSSAYCIVVSVDEGGLKQSLKKIIEELAINKKPMMLVLTKCDKKTPEDVASVLEQVKAEIIAITGEPLLSVNTASRRTKASGDTTESWHFALQQLQPLNQMFFHQRVGVRAMKLIDTLARHLQQLLNTENFTIEEIKGKQELLCQRQEQLREELQQTEKQLQEQVKPIADFICEQFKSRMTGNLESLASSLIHQSDISDTISTSLRMAYTMGIEARLKPLISSKLSQLENFAEVSVGQQSFSHDFQLDSVTSSIFRNVLSNLLPIALAALSRIPALMPFAPFIKSFLSSLFDNAAKEMAMRQQKEDARKYVLDNLIPKCLEQVDSEITVSLRKSIENVMAQVKAEADREMSHLQQSLNQLAEQLENEQASDANNKARYQTDQTELLTLLNKLKEYSRG